jgi:hypothetical protein
MRNVILTGLLAWMFGLAERFTIDPRVEKVSATKLPVSGELGTFINKPTYVTKTFAKEPDDFGPLVGFNLFRADTFDLRLSADGVFTVRLMKWGKRIFENSYRSGEGLELTDDGKILFPWLGLAAPHQTGIVAASGRISLFINDDDDLVVVKSSGSAGTVLIVIPFVTRHELMWIFPRAR